MKLSQHPLFKQFYLFSDHRHLLVFIKEATDAEIDPGSLFQPGFLKKFLFLFLFDEYTDPILKNSGPALTIEIDSFPNRISWIQTFGPANTIIVKSQPCIVLSLSGTNLSGTFNDFSYSDNFQLNTAGNKPIVTFSDPLISLDSPGDIELIMDEKTLAFQQASILLDKDNAGALNFNNNRKTNLIQPTSPYLTETQDRVTIHYFDQQHYDANSEIQTFYFPYPDKSRLNDLGGGPRSTRFILKKKSLKTNFVDSLGNQAMLDSDVTSYAGYTEFTVEGRNVGPFFHFMPVGDVDLVHKSNHLLLGFNGTESITNDPLRLTLNFEKNSRLQVDGDGLKDSLSSCTVLPKLNYGAYNSDAEKVPLFANTGAAGSTFIQPYAPIQITKNTTPQSLHLIPTLTFTDSPGLTELEKLFTKLRLHAHLPASAPFRVVAPARPAADPITSPDYITPQGFLRTGNKLDLVNPGPQPKDTGTVDVSFSINNITLTSDFNASVCKEDVFFVLKPSMLKGKPETMSVTLLLKGFKLDLQTFTPDVLKDDNTYIIFKFSRHSVEDLLKDPGKWSNAGSYKLSLPDANKLAADITVAANFAATADYKYFNETIKKDINWNGVVVVNIPIADSGQLPSIFTGLTSFQQLNPELGSPKLPLKTGMRFQYLAFTVNKTGINGSAVAIKNTSYYGVLDYDLLTTPNGDRSDDYPTVSRFFNPAAPSATKFLLTKLLIRFENSEVRNFQSFAFLQFYQLFNGDISLDDILLTHKDIDPTADKRSHLIRLNGNYQKNSAGAEEFNFTTAANLVISFPDDAGQASTNILKNITVSKLSFGLSPGSGEYRFDIDAKADINSWSLSELISIDELSFQNIGLTFKLGGGLPSILPDLSKLIVLPKISFNCKGFLSSFPIRFSHFECFKLTKKSDSTIDVNNDYWPLPGFKVPSIDIGNITTLFSFVFDLDLGTLGNLEALKALKGKLTIGWTCKGGFAMGFKFDSSGKGGLHVDLFGQLKLDIADLQFCTIPKQPPAGTRPQYLIKLIDASITFATISLPPDKDNVFSALIFGRPGDKIAWLLSYVKGRDPNPSKNKLLLGLGQRVGVTGIENMTTVKEGIDQVKAVFDPAIDACTASKIPAAYQPGRNWLVASESVLPDDWPIELQFIFNDPVLYGLHLGFKGDLLTGFSIDILYKRLSQNLGVYAMDIQLPDELRNHELGGAFLKLPNIGVEIYTNGDWKVDIGFPKDGNDWSRSGFLQLRTTPPFVGWFGFYIMQSKVASLTLFNGYITDDYSDKHLKIIQAGFAMRVGLGFYLDEGILFVGASITVYGILEGAFAFEKGSGLSSLFPSHFAVQGRMGALAELVGYVDFGIIKASVYFSLRAEFGMLLVYLGKDGIPGVNAGKGIQPVRIYIEGEVRVQVSLKIGCVTIHLGFSKSVRFEYTIGGGKTAGAAARNLFFAPNRALALTAAAGPLSIPIPITNIRNIPVFYLPSFSKVRDDDGEQLLLIHAFMIPFFAKNRVDGKLVFAKNNIFRTKMIKPLFDDLLSGLKNAGIVDFPKYETLRSVLLTGMCRQTTPAGPRDAKVEVTINGFTPTFINGINSTDHAVVDTVLQTHFGFGADEVKPPFTDNSIPVAYKDELMIMPAPIVKSIRVADSNDNTLHAAPNGFNIKLEGLVNNAATGTPIVETAIGAVTDFDDATLAWIEKFYDDYKTQFVNRGQQRQFDLAAAPNKDIREEVILPEYFKLLGLLTLEAVYSAANPKSKDGAAYNPSIATDANGFFVLDGTTTLDPDDLIEQIVGQLNYFYHNGLRLPAADGGQDTHSLYRLLHQDKVITPLPGSMQDPGNVKISFDNQDITADVFADDLAKQNMWTFIDQFGVGFSLDKLRNELDAIRPIRFLRPFDLIPATLSIQTGKLGEKDLSLFFELPRKLSQQAGQSAFYKFAVNYANTKDDNVELSTNRPSTPLLTGLTACLNIEIKFRKQPGVDRIYELVNVLAEDYNLMERLRSSGFMPDSIDLYYKPEASAAKPEDLLPLTRIITATFTILKTNLSPRTSPPIIEAQVRALVEDADNSKAYCDDSNAPDKTNFIRLLWEALTTNNGGYYLIPDKDTALPPDASGTIPLTGTLLLSFTTAAPAIPSWFNTLKVSSNDIVLQGLKDKSHYLYLDSLLLTEGALTDKPVLEYHPTIPAHTMGFNIPRNRSANPGSNYLHYLPMEFNLQKQDGTVVFSRDKVLPIMPLSEDETMLNYHHLSPLLVQDPVKDSMGGNLFRYAGVGSHFTLNVNLRDTYGYRTSFPGTNQASADYTHCYFDKLVPIDSWPLIRFSYWYKDFTGGKLQLGLSCQSEILEILDLAGINKDPIDPLNPKKGFKYRYASTNVIDKSNTGDTQTDVERLLDVIPGVLNNLYTISAQLNDVNTLATINGADAAGEKGKWANKVSQLIKNLHDLATPGSDGKYRMPANTATIIDLPVEIPLPDTLKNVLAINIQLKRAVFNLHQADDGMFEKKSPADPSLPELTNAYIWDYALTNSVISVISPVNPATGQSSLNDLDTVIRTKTGTLSLGISSEEKPASPSSTASGGKAIYLINAAKLSAIRAQNVSAAKAFDIECYFGIKPFSNQLWSGDYKPSATGSLTSSFSNIDLDKALKIVLVQIDALLQARGLSPELYTPAAGIGLAKDLYNKLVAAKKAIVDKKLKNKLAWTMDELNQPAPGNQLTDEFRSLLLDTLDNFYAYDGVVKTTLTGLDLLGNNHRLTINLLSSQPAGQQPYNLLSSKPGLGSNEWYILFDQPNVTSDTINFSIQPQISHLEFDISTVPDSEIEHSTWIQLIKAIPLVDDTYSVNNWPKITREFPDKAVILTHSAQQRFADGSTDTSTWQADKLGQWIYDLEVKDSYVVGDIIHVDLQTSTIDSRSLALVEEPNFEGFIAYWASRTIDAAANNTSFSDYWKTFVSDLDNQLSLSSGFAAAADAPPPPLSFELHKTAGAWEIINVIGGITVEFPKNASGQPIKDKPFVSAGPFNIFDPANRVSAAIPLIKVFRNRDILNTGFVYETESIQPVTAATPHIKYYAPIALKTGDSFEKNVFGTIVNPVIPNQLALKTMAKYLLDTAGKDAAGKSLFPATIKTLPVIPVRQLELGPQSKPTAPDGFFTDFDPTNGFAAFSLTIYRDDSDPNTVLPIFSADTIVRLK